VHLKKWSQKMSQNFEDLIARLEVVFRDKDVSDPEYIEMTNELLELTMADRQLFLQKLNSRSGGVELRDKIVELFENSAELDAAPAAPAEEICLAGDPTTDPDDKA
jgi:hypothetical protein